MMQGLDGSSRMILGLRKSEFEWQKKKKFRAYGKMTINGDELCENGSEDVTQRRWQSFDMSGS